jgi:acetyl esterase/lipase
VYGNFSSGFSPTLIQGGTKEILLSDFVRLYQALDQAGIPVKLDLRRKKIEIKNILVPIDGSEYAFNA